MCGGFTCSRNALTALNVLYLIVSFVLIGVASYAKVAAIITSIQLAGGIIASGLFLFFISLLGLFSTAKHHQVLLFFYVVVLFLLFLIQFGVSIACLALSRTDENTLLETAWSSNVGIELQDQVQQKFACCGWNGTDQQMTSVLDKCRKIEDRLGCLVPPNNTTTSPPMTTLPPCPSCQDILLENVDSVMVAMGGIGLFFSFTEMLGVYLAIRFRNQKDPKANPSQFL